jgi:hypothetical protein
MAKNNAITVFQDLPPWAKGVIAVGGLAIIYFAGRGLLKKFKSDAEKKKAQETVSTQNAELKKQLQMGARPSYADSQYKAWADKIQNQFTGVDFRQNIVDKDVPLIGMWSGSGKLTRDIITNLKNNVDFLKLNQAFGVRTYSEGLLLGTFTGNLTQAINDELDRGEIIALNNILSKNKITYQF